MSLVGIIANPAAGKDIRRLVAHGRVVPDGEKVNLLRRILVGLASAGVARVAVMPDLSSLGRRALDGLDLPLEAVFLDMPVLDTDADSTRAARLMASMGAGCLVTVGGDGTNRAVALGCGQVPLVAISTGTNNVFPAAVEGTVGGMAAGLVARGLVPVEEVSVVTKRLEVYVDGSLRGIALIDVATSAAAYRGARAIWDVSSLRELFLTRAEPGAMGLSSIGAQLHPLPFTAKHGLYLRMGPGRVRVLATIAPGLVLPVRVAQWHLFPAARPQATAQGPCAIALDGEREFLLHVGQQAEVMLTHKGPRLVDVLKTLRRASRLGLFKSKEGAVPR